MKIGFFSGQGSQKQNMGLDFVKKYELAKNIFTQAQEIINDKFDLKSIVSTDFHLLEKTKYAQPVIFIFNYLVSECLKKYHQINFNVVLGLSLGEYNALVYAGVIDFNDCLQLILKRGEAMESACLKSKTSMLAILSGDSIKIEKLINKYSKNKIFISNYNSNQQIVVGGLTKDIEEFKETLSDHNIRSIVLKTEGAFHTKFMEEAKNKFIPFLKQIKWKKPHNNIKILSNYTGNFYSNNCILDEQTNILSEHIVSPVKFQQEIDRVCKLNVTSNYEIGAKRTISRFFSESQKKALKKSIFVGDVNF